MGGWSLPHLILFAVIAFVLFGGRNKISDVMGDVAKGIKSFKKGLADDDEPKPAVRPVGETPRTLDHYPVPPQPVSQVDPLSEPRKAG